MGGGVEVSPLPFAFCLHPRAGLHGGLRDEHLQGSLVCVLNAESRASRATVHLPLRAICRDIGV